MMVSTASTHTGIDSCIKRLFDQDQAQFDFYSVIDAWSTRPLATQVSGLLFHECDQEETKVTLLVVWIEGNSSLELRQLALR